MRRNATHRPAHRLRRSPDSRPPPVAHILWVYYTGLASMPRYTIQTMKFLGLGLPPRLRNDFQTLKSILPYIWEYKARVVVAVACLILANVANVRSEERRVGKGCVITFSFWWWTYF